MIELLEKPSYTLDTIDIGGFKMSGRRVFNPVKVKVLEIFYRPISLSASFDNLIYKFYRPFVNDGVMFYDYFEVFSGEVQWNDLTPV